MICHVRERREVEVASHDLCGVQRCAGGTSRQVVARARALERRRHPRRSSGPVSARSIASVAQEDDQVIDLSARFGRLVDPLEVGWEGQAFRVAAGRGEFGHDDRVGRVGLVSATFGGGLRNRPHATSGLGCSRAGVTPDRDGRELCGGLGSLRGRWWKSIDPNWTPTRLRILEKNLAIIDRAIEESGCRVVGRSEQRIFARTPEPIRSPQGGLPPRCLGDLWLVDLIER